ncbi:MAG TPA: PEP-CTERM sorting domain-containing protein [Tepidisphaeraceae bacterium]|jgi:MYXO-CTERM domain-containing protein|nr:PEP-CTERM sorting domain-containing protein [Tepidisphaeraceae bacterium]
MQRSRIYTIAAVTVASLMTSWSNAATVLINHDFTNAVRNVGAGPTFSVNGIDIDGVTPLTNDYVISTNGNANMATGTSASNVGPGINGNSLFVLNEANAFSVTARFANTSLAVGDSLSLTATIRTSGAAPTTGASAFRIGLFDRGTIETTNNSNAFGGATGGATSNGYSDDTGYVANYSPTAGSPGSVSVKAQKRPVAAGNLFAGVSDIPGGAGTSSASNFAADVNYPVVFTLTRTALGSVSISSSVNGAVLATSDSTSPFTTFNELGLFFGSQFGNATTPRSNFIDDVAVTFTPAAVPEPAALGVLALGGLAALRRRRI